MQKIMHEIQSETGGESEDVDILLRPASEWGVEYSKLQQDFQIFHGTADTVVLPSSAEWLSAQIKGNSRLPSLIERARLRR